MQSTIKYDIIIIGAGPSGMTAAIYAARAGLRCILLEENITGGLVNSTHTVENFPSYITVNGIHLMEKMREHVDSLHVPIEEVCEIEKIDLKEKVVFTDSGIYTAPCIILATGRTPIALDTPTTCAQTHFCAICDGLAYKDKSVLIVGGGNSAFDESLYLLSLGVKKITLIEKMPQYFAAQSTQDMLFKHSNVDAFTQHTVQDLIVVNDILKGAILFDEVTQTTKQIGVDGIFVFLGQKPNNSLFANQITLTKAGYIEVNARMQTSLEGVFAAGDIVEKPFRQITTAIADGTIAALSADQYLRTLDKG